MSSRLQCNAFEIIRRNSYHSGPMEWASSELFHVAPRPRKLHSPTLWTSVLALYLQHGPRDEPEHARHAYSLFFTDLKMFLFVRSSDLLYPLCKKFKEMVFN